MPIFSRVSESQITRAIVDRFSKDFLEYVESDVIVIGAGPSGLVCAKTVAEAGGKVAVFESNNYLGGGFWIGGYLMNTATIRAPGQEILQEMGVPCEEIMPGLFATYAPHACSALIASACAAGAHVFNMTSFDDVVLREGNRVAGAVVNWTPIRSMPRQITCVDPVAVEGKVVVDATGHDARVCESLRQRGLLEIKGMSGMWVNESEDAIVEHTKEVHPGLIVCGMAVSTLFGLPRMGPTFGGMLVSGRVAAEKALELIGKLAKSA